MLQASVWLVLSLAIATMLSVGGPFAFLDALRFSSANWMPWALLTPLVFWLSRRFPVVRGRFVRHVPIHLAGCLACSVAASWATSQLPANFLVLRGSRGFTPPGAPPGSPPLAFESVVIGSGPHTTIGDGPAMSFAISGGSIAHLGSASGSVTLFAPAGATEAHRIPGLAADRLDAGALTTHESSTTMTVPHAAGAIAVSSLALPAPPPHMPWPAFLVPLAMRANVGLAIYLVIASAAHAMAFYRQAQERERQALALLASRNQAKLDALRLQLQPHFLFNALNAIATLMHEDPVAADDLMGDLSDLLRVSLQTSAHEVTLERELALLDHYLAIEQARLGDRLRIVRDIDASASGAYVPTLILQPLAENAVRHGLEPRRAPGTLTLRARRDGDTLHLSVADDGVGFGAAPRRTGRHGIGLANSEERLRTLHDGRAKLRIVSPPEGGVRVEIMLPFRRVPAPANSAHLREAVEQ